MKKICLLLVAFVMFTAAGAQENNNDEMVFPKFNAGLGMGIDYGGFGARATALVSERFQFFGALGYNLLGVGFNLGGDVRLMPKSPVCPYIGAMYGYNAVIKITGLDGYNKIYYGPSFPLGLEIWSKRRPAFFNFELVLPLRSQAYHDAIKDLKNNPAVVFSAEPIPIAFSIGYHFVL